MENQKITSFITAGIVKLSDPGNVIIYLQQSKIMYKDFPEQLKTQQIQQIKKIIKILLSRY